MDTLEETNDKELIDQMNRRLELQILPTEQCNFRCVYCNQHYEIKRMTHETVNATKKLLDRRIPSLDYLNIQWFGGEPLAGYGIVLDIMSHTNRKIGETNPNEKLTQTSI